MKRRSRNVDLLIVLVYGYVLQAYRPVLNEIMEVVIPALFVTVIYYLACSVAYRKWDFTFLLLVSATFISLFFAYITFGEVGWAEILASPEEGWLAIMLYSFLFIPVVFFTFTADFYALAQEIASVTKARAFYLIVPVLMKRELILHRFNVIMDTLEARGTDTKAWYRKYVLLPKWIVPLAITTLMEGVESYEYNKMLKTDIFTHTPRRSRPCFSKGQRILLGLAVLLIMLSLFV